MKKVVLFQMLSFCKWCLKFWIFFTKLNFNIITFMTVIWIIAKKSKKKQTLKFWKPWIWWIFLLFLVLTRDRNNFQTKLSLSRHRNLKFNKFKIFVGNCDLKKKIKFEEFESAQICNVFFEMSEFSIWKNLSWNYT